PPRRKIVKMEEVMKLPEGGFDSGVIRFEVDNISWLDDDGRCSSEIEAGGVPWKAMACKSEKEEKDHLFVGLKAKNIPSSLWSIEVECKIILVNSDYKESIFYNL
ncbi:hypothetical protein PENTCL1PPCAC_23838, partial [Pristionchus entomophagus]